MAAELALGSILIAIFLALTIAAGLAPSPPRRVVFDHQLEVEDRLVGGVMWYVMRLPWGWQAPFATLLVTNRGVRVKPTVRLMAPFIPTWDVAWPEILHVSEMRIGIAITHVNWPKTPIKFLAFKNEHRHRILVAITNRVHENA
jgi:hypothetical protein